MDLVIALFDTQTTSRFLVGTYLKFHRGVSNCHSVHPILFFYFFDPRFQSNQIDNNVSQTSIYLLYIHVGTGNVTIDSKIEFP